MRIKRESNPKFLRARQAIMAAILAMGIASLASTTCSNPAAKPQAADGVTAGLALMYSGARNETSIIATQGRSLGGDTVTDASVMWGSFATPATSGERTCKSPALPASGMNAWGASGGRGQQGNNL